MRYVLHEVIIIIITFIYTAGNAEDTTIWITGLVSIATVVLCRWRVETNIWFINRVGN